MKHVTRLFFVTAAIMLAVVASAKPVPFPAEGMGDELVTLPSGAVTEYWVMNGTFTVPGYGTEQEWMAVGVYIDGNDIYVQGLSYYFPDAWLKGTISGGTATFPSGQFVGESVDQKEYMVGCDDGETLCDIVFTYDASTSCLTLKTQYLVENVSTTKLSFWGYRTDAELSSAKLMTLPSGAVPEQWELKGTYITQSNTKQEERRVGVFIDGDFIYVQGLSYFFPDAWLKGTIIDDSVVFPPFQFVGKDNVGREYMVGSNNGNDVCRIGFAYDAEAKTLVLDTEYMVDNDGNINLSSWGYWEDMELSALSGDKLVTPPAGAEEEEWSFDATYNNEGGSWDISTMIPVIVVGNDIYIKNTAIFFGEAWIKGTISGTTATFPAGQYMGTEVYGSGYIVGSNDMQTISDIEFGYNAAAKKLTQRTKYFIENKSKTEIDSYGYWTNMVVCNQEQGDPDAFYDDVIAPPSDIATETWIMTGKLQNDVEMDVRIIQVAFVGNDIYVQGLAYYLPDAWMKGTISDGTVTFPIGQFVGISDYGKEYMVGSEDLTTDVCDIVFTYDAEAQMLTQKTLYVLENKNSIYDVSYRAYFTDLELSAAKLVTLPSGAVPEQWELQGTYSNKYQKEKSVGVYIDGNDIYVQGLANYFEDAWMKGTISGETAIFPAFQFVGEDEYGKEYMAGSDDGMTPCDIVFTYSAKAHKLLNQETSYIIENDGVTKLDAWGFWTNVTIRELTPVTPPENLATTTYMLNDKERYYDEEESVAYTREVWVGFDGQDVYIQGFCYECPNLWVRGTLDQDGYVTIPACQYMGNHTSIGLIIPLKFFTALDADDNFVDAVFYYDSETKTFTTDQKLAVNNDDAILSDPYFLTDVRLELLPDVAATPANPIFKEYDPSDEVGYFKAEFPDNDVDGNHISTQKLYYQVWIEKDGTKQPYTFTAELYSYDLTEDLTEIPCNFDGYDLYSFYSEGTLRVGIYFEDALEELATWTNIGIQSIYYGGGEIHKSDIVWMYPVQKAGDVNGDSYIDTQDVLSIYEYMQKGTSEHSLSALDVNTDGFVDTQDVLTIYEIMQKAESKRRSIRTAKQQRLKELSQRTLPAALLPAKEAKAVLVKTAKLPK